MYCQASQLGHLKSTIDWKLQTSPGFMDNGGKIKIGDTTWLVEQQTKSFATMEDQELLLKFKLSIPVKQQDHLFLFHHKVRSIK